MLGSFGIFRVLWGLIGILCQSLWLIWGVIESILGSFGQFEIIGPICGVIVAHLGAIIPIFGGQWGSFERSLCLSGQIWGHCGSLGVHWSNYFGRGYWGLILGFIVTHLGIIWPFWAHWVVQWAPLWLLIANLGVIEPIWGQWVAHLGSIWLILGGHWVNLGVIGVHWTSFEVITPHLWFIGSIS